MAFEANAAYHNDLWKIIDWFRENDAMISLGSNARSRREGGSIVHIHARGRDNEED